jgi:hypothetical protein
VPKDEAVLALRSLVRAARAGVETTAGKLAAATTSWAGLAKKQSKVFEREEDSRFVCDCLGRYGVMAAFCLRILAYRLPKPRPLSNGVLFERQNKTIIIITVRYGLAGPHQCDCHAAEVKQIVRICCMKYSRTECTRNNYERIVSLNNMESEFNGRVDTIVQENVAGMK